MLWCQAEMGDERGAQMHALLEDLLGREVSCAGGCPLFDARPRAVPPSPRKEPPLVQPAASGF